jgi:low temperature requirement protein LtrA
VTGRRPPQYFPDVLRAGSPDPDRVTYVELFFDLVFAFAVTQIAGVLTESPTLFTIAEAVIVTLAIWWVWVYTTWATNWLNPDARSVLWFLLALTATGLVISESLPSAFGSRRFIFVGAYLLYAAIRTIGVIRGVRTAAPLIAGGQYRILVWTAVAGIAWVGGCFVSETGLRVGLWAVAILIEYAGPAVLFWLPGIGKSSWEAWNIRGGHFSERAALFIIIVLGESILVVGAGLSTELVTPAVLGAAAIAFADAVILWFLYFAHGQNRGHQFISQRESTGPVARLSYTYLHVVLVLGLVATTHASHLALQHPFAIPSLAVTALVLVGPMLYLLGLFAFKSSIGVPASWIPSHVIGAAVMAVLFVLRLAGLRSTNLLELSAIACGVLLLVVSGDELLWRKRVRESSTETAD